MVGAPVCGSVPVVGAIVVDELSSGATVELEGAVVTGGDVTVDVVVAAGAAVVEVVPC